MGAVRTGVADQPEFLGDQVAVSVDPGPVGEGLRVAGPAGIELFGSGQLQLHWSAGGDGQMGHDVLDQHLLLRPEATADPGLDHPDVFDVHANQGGQHPAGMERHLGGGAHHQSFVTIQPGHRDVRFDRALLDLMNPEGLLVDLLG